jgi:hypothetical protein
VTVCGVDCRVNVVHTILHPDDHGRNRTARLRRWPNILVLQAISRTQIRWPRSGNQSVFRRADRRGSAFRPARIHGEREQNNVALLTRNYDVIYIADAVAFARYVPYQTEPAAAGGRVGRLVADAWHWSWERQGPPAQRPV